MRIAAIDCGTNSLHLLIAQMDDEGRYDVLHDLKEMPRLGEGVVKTGLLSEAAMTRALQTLEEYAHICRRFGVERIRAVATSAVRRARNGGEFVTRVHQHTGIPLTVISGEEEARLVAQALLAEPGFSHRRFMIFNVGGGSTEFAWGRGRQIREMTTLPVGAVTLTEEYLKADPPRGADVRALESAVKRMLIAEVPSMAEQGFTLYGTGGTVTAMVGIHQVLRFGVGLGSVFYPITRDQVREVYLTLQEKDLAQRRQLPGLKGSRAEIIVGGAAIVAGIMQYLGAPDMLVSGHGLKYGLLAEEAREAKRHLLLALLDQKDEVKSPEVLHAIHTRELAWQIFDATRDLHGLGDEARDILGMAALLHDIGHSVDGARHHKHTYTLIREASLPGIEGQRKELIAMVARYHRKASPRRKHPAFAALAREERRTVRMLAGILRVADGLDRSHSQAVFGVQCKVDEGSIDMVARSTRISTLDKLGAERNKDLLEKVLKRRIRVTAEEVERSAHV
jgi:exopolyphosphatase/guanosine-5'-triphosphate,3'-diphosphate pyrophosphatase